MKTEVEFKATDFQPDIDIYICVTARNSSAHMNTIQVSVTDTMDYLQRRLNSIRTLNNWYVGK